MFLQELRPQLQVPGAAAQGRRVLLRAQLHLRPELPVPDELRLRE